MFNPSRLESSELTHFALTQHVLLDDRQMLAFEGTAGIFFPKETAS